MCIRDSRNSDWPALHRNLKKARKRWAMVAHTLEKHGASKKALGMFYRAVVQAVLLHGCETWTFTKAMCTALEGFHHRVARRITGKVAWKVGDDWIWPSLVGILPEAGLFSIRECVHRRQATMVDYVATRPIHDLCRAAQRRPGSSRREKWWTQAMAEPEVESSGVDDSGSGSGTDGSE